jgi:hypothetical protein
VIAALEKAESLARFARSQGAPLETFLVTLTEPQAYELLDHIAAGGLGRYEDHDRLIADVEEAKRKKAPFALLEWFQLEGMSIAPVSFLQ